MQGAVQVSPQYGIWNSTCMRTRFIIYVSFLFSNPAPCHLTGLLKFFEVLRPGDEFVLDLMWLNSASKVSSSLA
jgi:hypothetical protein